MDEWMDGQWQPCLSSLLPQERKRPKAQAGKVCHKETCETDTQTQEAGLDPIVDCEEKMTTHRRLQSLEDNQTFTLTPLPEDRETVGGRWVYSIKEGRDGHEQY